MHPAVTHFGLGVIPPSAEQGVAGGGKLVNPMRFAASPILQPPSWQQPPLDAFPLAKSFHADHGLLDTVPTVAGSHMSLFRPSLPKFPRDETAAAGEVCSLDGFSVGWTLTGHE